MIGRGAAHPGPSVRHCLHGVEPICKVLPIAPSTYYAHVTNRDDPEKLSTRARRDIALKPEIVRVFKANFEVYGVKKVWRSTLGYLSPMNFEKSKANQRKGLGEEGKKAA